MAHAASEWAGEVIHSACVEEESRRQRVRISVGTLHSHNLGKKENVGCVAALMPCNNSNQRAKEMRIWATAFVLEMPESWYPYVISSLICRMRVGMGGNESGKQRGRDVEGTGIRPLEGGRKDVLWNYLRFLNPLLSTLRHVAKPRFSPSRWEIHPTYVLLLTDILYVLAITDVWYAPFKPALLVSWYNRWNYLNRKKEQVCSVIYDGFVSK